MDYTLLGWVRKEQTTPGSDPTTVVTFTKGEVSLIEFQGVYVARVGAMDMGELAFIADLHKALELHYSLEQELDARAREEYEAEHYRP